MNDKPDSNQSRGNGKDQADNIVSRAVGLGYDVIEEQLKQGQKAAEQLASGNMDATQLDGSASEMAERIVRFYSDMGALWSEMLQSLTRNGAMRDLIMDSMPGNGWRNDGASTEQETPPDKLRSEMVVEINSPVATGARVAVDLQGDKDMNSMMMQPLHARDPNKPPLADIHLIPPENGWPPTVRVTIPEGQPHGTYSGVILAAATDEPVGTVCLRIPQQASEPQS